ncbi:hypothetical protein C8D92_10475 [Tamilnaduibacter salinus]|uniref:Large polyvalent protein-associated domain-containing protein n=1 Tax=Tamilnaduibacter salinus TaxID=1484056 RepID=A0A2U1CX63_9GAMM|nr:CLCA_X family protein [Tamilnaduibacter salinus]PVY76844.1 hypothetical protein C8D92_10475 [Tamilnaduibacter salinus]
MTPTFATIRRQFGFRSIEIGHWVTDAERDAAAVEFHQALNDLQLALRAPAVLISLRDSLGLQYGIGGQLGVAAHYTPAIRKLALAKRAGRGALAHEWFHALDHYLAPKVFETDEPMAFASACWCENRETKAHPINDQLAEVFRTLFVSEDGQDTSALFRHSVLADERQGVHYYARPEEMAARGFEAFVQDVARPNPFLVSGTRQSLEARHGLYPQGEERRRINNAFARYFQSLGRALDRERRLRQSA